MTRAEQNRLKRALEAYVRDATVNEHTARKALKETGIFTKGGKVSARYGGRLTGSSDKQSEITPAKVLGAKVS